MRKARKVMLGVLATLLLVTVALAVPAGSAIAASDSNASPTAVDAKKKCRKGYVRKKKRCVKKKRRTATTSPGSTAPASPAPTAPAGPAPTAPAGPAPTAPAGPAPTAPAGPAPTAPAGPAPTAPAAPGPTGPAWAEGRWRGFYAENGVELLFNVLGGRLYTGGFDDFFIQATCAGGDPDPSAISPVQASIAPNGDFSGSGVYSPGFGLQLPWQLSGHISGTSITGSTFTVGPYTNTFGNSCGGTTHFTGQWIADYTF
jgi:hypothetical protein